MQRAIASCLLLCVIAIPSRAVQAADFYVDPISGSDAGTGSARSPWRTIEAVVAARKIETRNWASLPYAAGATLVTVNPGAPVKAGDTIWLRSGFHGALLIRGAYNLAPITIAAQRGQSPQLSGVVVQAASNWTLRGLSISPSHAPPPLARTTIVNIASSSQYGPASNIVVEGNDISSLRDASGWSAAQWVDLASNGISVGAADITVRGNRVRNVRFGISVSGARARVQGNTVDGFSADGLRGLGDDGLFEYNLVQNSYIGGAQDSNHDDGFQSWSVGQDGVGTGVVSRVTLRGNVFINATDPANPLRGTMQGIGCFDGLFDGWIVEDNVVITDHWNGIAFYGMRNSRINNNTLVDINTVSPGPPWILVTAHKDGRLSENVVVRNNLGRDFRYSGTNVVGDHNLLVGDAATVFMSPPYDLRLREGSPAIDAGSAAQAPAMDALRVTRPQGTAIDVGAYERCVQPVRQPADLTGSRLAACAALQPGTHWFDDAPAAPRVVRPR